MEKKKQKEKEIFSSFLCRKDEWYEYFSSRKQGNIALAITELLPLNDEKKG